MVFNFILFLFFFLKNGKKPKWHKLITFLLKLGILGQCGKELANFVEKSVKLNEDIATVTEGLPLQPDRNVQINNEKLKEQCKEFAQEMF